jgi:integrase
LQRLFTVLTGKPALADPKKPEGDVIVVDPDVIDFLKLALLTGARRNNVLKMRWSDLDLERGLWRIPAKSSKNKQTMTVILPPTAVAILEKRSRLEDVDEVFRRSNGKFPYVVKQWTAIRKAAAIKDVRMHDLRRTLGSWAAGTGASLPIIGKALGHRTPSSTAIYSRLDVDPVRRAVEIATSAMLAFDTHTPKALPAPNTE